MCDRLPPFQAFLNDQLGPVRAFLRGMVGPHDAEDCLQETFLAALRAYPRADGRNLHAWIFTIARHKAIDHHRASARRPGLVGDAEALADRADATARGPHEAAVGISPRHSAIWAAVADLPAGQRAAVVLRFAVDLRYREVGEALGTSEETARRNVHDALKKLRAKGSDLKEMAR